MEAILQALGGLLLRALPTFFIVVLLHFYLKWAFFSPMDRLLRERRAATEGAREAAEASLNQAAQLGAQYEEALRATRAELYKEQEEARRQWRQEQAASIAQARQRAQALINNARAELAVEAAAAREALRSDSGVLAERIAAALLRGSSN